MEETVATAVENTGVAAEAEAVLEAVSEGNVSSDLLADFGRSLLDYVPTVLLAIVLFIVGKIIAKIIMKIIDKAMDRTHIEQTAQSFLRSLVNIVLTAFVIVIALSTLGIPMTSIITAIGAAGVAIGLALQNSLSNVAGGFIILFSKPFSKGDYITTNGVEGVVDDISILSTKLITVDNKVVFVPNGMVSSGTITNFSRESKRRVDLVFSISYDQDFKAAVGAIKSVMAAHSLILQDDDNFVRISELGESAVKITVRAWTLTDNYWTVYFDLIEQIKSEFDSRNIEIPYNKLDVNVVNVNK